MPHEVQVGILDTDFDFAFLTVDQLDYIDDDSIDLAINCDSFQEMTHEQIAIYFKLIQRVTVESGIFFTTNRVEKIPVPNEINSYNTEQIEPPNRFFDYPWNDKNEILAGVLSLVVPMAVWTTTFCFCPTIPPSIKQIT